jgi:hypothetical protein
VRSARFLVTAAVELQPGNTSDVTVARALIADLPALPEGVERVWISDAGMVSAELLGLIDETTGWKRLTAEGPRKSELGQRLLRGSRGRYRGHPTKADFGYKVFEVAAEDSPSGKRETLLITRNERDRERQLDKIAEHVERVKDALAKQPTAGTAQTKEVCKTVSNLSLKRYVKPSESVVGAFVLDQKAIAQERMLAGVRFYRTTKTDWSGLDIIQRLQGSPGRRGEAPTVQAGAGSPTVLPPGRGAHPGPRDADSAGVERLLLPHPQDRQDDRAALDALRQREGQ